MKLSQVLIGLACFVAAVFGGCSGMYLNETPPCKGDFLVDETGVECPGGASPGTVGAPVDLTDIESFDVRICQSDCQPDWSCPDERDKVIWVGTTKEVLGFEYEYDSYVYKTAFEGVENYSHLIHGPDEKNEVLLGVVFLNGDNYIETWFSLITVRPFEVLDFADFVLIESKEMDPNGCGEYVSQSKSAGLLPVDFFPIR